MSQILNLFKDERISGVIVLIAVLLALIAANSPAAEIYALIHHTPVHFRFGPLIIDEPLVKWINEGLMVIFFLMIGLEIKQQLLEGHLSTLKQAALPIFAAFGGMMLPASLYVGLAWDDPNALRGWAIPTATDIVLALTVLSLLGSRIPVGLRIFLTALAIFDDLGAIIIISLFYGQTVAATPLIIAGFALLGLLLINRLQIFQPVIYIAIGLVLWIAMHKSGVEASLTGFFIALSIPIHIPKAGASSPLRRTEKKFHIWNVLFVIPLFAFFNAGININQTTDFWPLNSVSLGIIVGLCIGKQVGVFIASRIAVATGLAQLPKNVTWFQLYGVALLSGIGFTMSTFVATLAFPNTDLIVSAKISILLGSVLSATVGVVVIYLSTTKISSK
ncbi:Na+/H+ antiporter NhaA [Kiloniella antarctica]|uniref:Na(+)/H(+) antiporter NhaA n=1 Tax=Kiloniella antarctica TaxID=1550907 RepID=A0ABW5BRX2_9PROT